MNEVLNHVMIDIEGLGTRPGCAVVELAAVAFDLATGKTGSEFRCALKPAPPFTATLATLAWHEEKGSQIEKPGALWPREAVLRFLDWLDDRVVGPPADRVFWSWGITYDFPILEPLLDLRNPEDPHPWEYLQVEDARTIWRRAFGKLRHAPRPHDALVDCRMAIADLVAAHRELTAGRDLAARLVDWDREHGEATDIMPPAFGRKLHQIIASARDLAPAAKREEAE